MLTELAQTLHRGVPLREVVIITGAGASVGLGLPALNWVFDDPCVRDYLGGEAAELLEFLDKFIWKPRGFTIDTAGDSLNIEEVLTLLKQWSRGKATGPPVNFARNQRIQRQLLGCVHRSVYMDKKDNGERFMNELVRFVDGQYDRVTWATFNWDAKFEQAFYREMEPLGPTDRLPRCLDGLQGWLGTNPKHLMLKLHGSVTWFQRSNGKEWYSVHFGKYDGKLPVNEQWQTFLSTEGADEPLIAEPSFFKHDDIPAKVFLFKEWEEFDRALSSADVVFVCGYSLPDGDAKAKESLLTAVARNPNAKWIVVDPDRCNVVRPRYERVLGVSRLDFRKQFLKDFVEGL